MGDTHPPFQLPEMGILYIVEAILLIIGTTHILKRNKMLMFGLVIFSCILLLPAALTFVTPAANRSFNFVLLTTLLSAVGITVIAKNKFFRFGLIIIFAISVGLFLKQYFVVLPKEQADWWHWGYKQLFAQLEELKHDYDNIYVSGQTSMPYIFYLFYNQIDPHIAQTELKRNLRDDEYGFEHVEVVDKYIFLQRFETERFVSELPPNSLLVLTSDEP
jgi:hypothetical protein